MLEYRSPLSFEHVSSWEGLQHLRIQRSKNLQDCLQAKTESLKERTVYILGHLCEQFAQQSSNLPSNCKSLLKLIWSPWPDFHWNKSILKSWAFHARCNKLSYWVQMKNNLSWFTLINTEVKAGQSLLATEGKAGQSLLATEGKAGQSLLATEHKAGQSLLAIAHKAGLSLLATAIISFKSKLSQLQI